jgi:hypothetical protein
VIGRNSISPEPNEGNVTKLKPEQGGSNRFGPSFQKLKSFIRDGIVFIVETPRSGNRCIDDEAHYERLPSSLHARISSRVTLPDFFLSSRNSRMA